MLREPVDFRQTLPSQHLLRAAYRVAGLVSPDGVALEGVRVAYRQLPTNGLFSAGDLRRGEGLLKGAGLLERGDGRLRAHPSLEVLRGLEEDEACRTLLGLLLRRHPPGWLGVALGRDAVHLPYLPDGVLRRLEQIFGDRDDLLAFLAGLAPADHEARSELGRAGEERVVAACRRQRREAGHGELARQVQRVSRLSDAFGYDVSAPRPRGEAHHLEVKTVGRPGPVLPIHLSRHQVRVARSDSHWRLVVCERVEGGIEVVGWCDLARLGECWPTDSDGGNGVRARWESAAVDLERDRLTTGLPPLGPSPA
jgi:hypothetical protein